MMDVPGLCWHFLLLLSNKENQLSHQVHLAATETVSMTANRDICCSSLTLPCIVQAKAKKTVIFHCKALRKDKYHGLVQKCTELLNNVQENLKD